MGNCISGCFGNEKGTPNDNRKVSHVYPTQFVPCIIPPSDKNDEKFYFIKNEDEIDKRIDDLDDTVIMDEAKIALLEHTLAELRNEKNKLTIFPSYDSADDFSPVREDIENEEGSPAKGQVLLPAKDEVNAKQRRSQTMMDFTEISFGKRKKDINQGLLLLEVQKGHFIQSQFLKRYDLCKPFILIKIYLTEKGKAREIRTNNWTEITKFQTPFASDSLRPSWDELFEHRLSDEKKVSPYSFGFTLFYIFNKDQTSFQVGTEQIFSVGSLLDQKMQVKTIDFKDPDYKGVLARVRVRFQFVHDQELLKGNLVRELKAKMERVVRIRDRHPVFKIDGKERGSFLYSLRLSKRGSLSSTHENEEGSYYMNQN